MPKVKSITKAASKLSFQKDFFSDLHAQNMLYAVTVRSPVQKGKVISVSHPDLPDGYFLFSAKDIPGKNNDIFCDGTIKYLGEPVALLAGPNLNVIHSLLEELDISIDSADEEEKTEQELPSLKIAERNINTGSCFTEEESTLASMNKVFEKSDFVAQEYWTYSLNIPNTSEPNGALCTWANETLTVFTPTQWPKNLRETLSNTLNIPGDSIIVKKTQSNSHDTNSVWYNSVIACQVALASIKTGKPVKLVYTREEQNAFMDNAQAITITHKSAADKDGRLTAMQIDIDVDAGYSNPFAQEIVDRLVISACGCYTAENVSITATVLRSSKPPASIDMELIDSAAFFAVENQMNKLAEKCSLTPLELKAKNLSLPQKKERFNFQINKGSEILSTLARMSDYNRKYASYHLDRAFTDAPLRESSRTFPARGIGLSCAFEGSGYIGSRFYGTDQSIEVTLEENESITIHCPPVSSSIESIFERLAANILGISVSSVKVNSEYTSEKEPALPESVYCNISIMSVLLKKCCEAILKRKEGTALPYTVRKKLSQVQKKLWNEEDFSGTPFHRTSFAAACVELELDTCTYRENIKNINIIVNGGRLLNILSAEASIRLAVQKVLGAIVEGEQISAEKLKISFIQSEDEPSQIGELVYHVLPAAYSEALSQALGCTINSLPLATDTLYKRLQENKIHLLAKKRAEMEAAQKEAELKEAEQEEAASEKENEDVAEEKSE